jgi:uncharacterized membrane protein
MIEVILYSREECHLCEIAEGDLASLQSEIPHNITIIDIDSDQRLLKEFGSSVPVIKIGPYTLKAPVSREDIEVTLRAAQHRQVQIESVDRNIEQSSMKLDVTWTGSDKFSYWLSRHYLAIFNLFVLFYLGLPVLAPILMTAGVERPAGWIYRIYGAVCHELAFRSWFIFGEQLAYPREAAGIDNYFTYGEVTGLDENDLWVARRYQGENGVGYKIALCQRDVAIYLGILLFGIIFWLTSRKISPLPWYLWIIFGIMPIAFDGLSQLISQPPFSLLPYRESTPILRSLTGFLFGFITAWFGFPLVEESMKDTREYMENKLKRVNEVSKPNQI